MIMIPKTEGVFDLFNCMPDPVARLKAVLDNNHRIIDFTFVDVNPAFETMVKKKKDNIMGKKVFPLFGAYSLLSLDNLASCAETAFTGKSTRYVQYSDVLGRWYEITIVSNEKHYINTIFRDITSYKLEEADVYEQAKKLLGEKEEHFQKMIEFIPVAIFAHDEAEILFANSAAAELLNFSSLRELAGKSLKEFLPPESRDEFEQGLSYVIENDNVNRTVMTRLYSNSKTPVETELILVPFTFQYGHSAQIVAYDITRRKNIEKELVKMEKLESISILAGGVAHDFNNYLATLLANISVARSYQDTEKIFERLESMRKTALDAKDLTRQLIEFADGGTPSKNKTSLNQLLNDSVKLALTGSPVRCNFNLPQEVICINVDKAQIHQVLYNLAINAVQAMPEGGTIKVKAEKVTLKGEDRIDYIPLPEGIYVKITIQDHGPGIPEKHLQKIFDPFFSTKIEGSGLGLATTYSIIKNHDGYIDVESGENQGTTFTIYLPVTLRHENN